MLLHINLFLTLSSFKKIEEKLPTNIFVRVHRSYIVSLKYIHSVQRNRIIIDQVRVLLVIIIKTILLKKLEVKTLFF